MKKRLTLMTIAMLTLVTLLLGLSCAPPPQNNANSSANAGQNNNIAAINANTAALALAADPCTATSDKPGKVKKQITDDILAKSNLKHQYDRHLFKLAIFPGSAPGSLYLYFTGKIGNPDGMGDLAAIVKKVLKKSCVEKVFFATDGTIPLSATAAPLSAGDFFEWFVCEDPKVPCVGGECKLPAECPAPSPDPVANSNTNTNTNTNTKPAANQP